jgi:Etoposide-induced protein 2.4 (EI24)
MKLLIDSFWRAAAYCLHPRVIALSLLPLLVMAAMGFGLWYFFWDPAVAWVRTGFESYEWMSRLLTWLEGFGAVGLKTTLAPLAVVVMATPLIVVVSLLLVAVLMTPSMLTLVANRRFPLLERRRGGSALGGVVTASWATAAALIAMVASVPLWFVPPLVLVLPPLIWGWLTYKVMTYDVLAEHATKEERQVLVKRHRNALLGMGVLTGYLGAAPSLVWASGVLFLTLAPLLVPIAVWIYTLVFAFSALWFAHYALNALHALRAERAAATTASAVTAGTVATPAAADAARRADAVVAAPTLPLPPA